jgi:cytoskeletal protein RodZ
MGPTHNRPTDEHGQVMSSVVALVAVVAVVVGLLVLFGTWGDDHEADKSTSPSPSQSSAPGSGSPTGEPTTGDPTAQPTAQPTVPPSTPTTRPTVPPTRPTVPTSPPSSGPTGAPTSAPTGAPTSAPTGEPTTTSNPGGGQVSRVPIEIYNNTTVRGMAERLAGELRATGWTVSGVDNWRGKVVGTTVYYQPAHRDDAEALASRIGTGRVKPALDNMRKGRLTVILTSDYVEEK